MELQKYYFIYQTTNKINGKIYVGKHETYDLNDGYIGSGKYLKKAIKKYGIENFERTILCFCKSEEEMNAKEKEIVTEDFVARKDTYNLKVGGEGGWGFINEVLHFNGNKAFIKNKTPEEMKEIRLRSAEGMRRYAASMTEEEHEQRSKYWIDYWKTHKPTFLGKTHSEKTKKKIGKANSIRQTGKGNSRYGTHWWMNPETGESRSIREGDPVPEGWIRGRKV